MKNGGAAVLFFGAMLAIFVYFIKNAFIPTSQTSSTTLDEKPATTPGNLLPGEFIDANGQRCVWSGTTKICLAQNAVAVAKPVTFLGVPFNVLY